MPDIVLALFAVTTLLALIGLLAPLSGRLGVPDSILFAVLGLALGAAGVAIGAGEAGGLAGEALGRLVRAEFGADAFLVIFLPPLLFTAGLTIDVRLLYDEGAAVLLLAVVAVAVTTAAVGWTLAAAGSAGLGTCLLLGAIVAPTDPGAVVGLFRDTRAPRRLSILVSGESLFNDAAAIAIFVILLDMLTGASVPEIGPGLRSFAFSFLGGAGLGWLLARASAAVLPWTSGFPLAAITLTPGLAYLSWILAESWLGVSGVVAVVSAALTFAAYGRARIEPDTWERLTRIWEQLEFWANALIFVLAAMFAARVLSAPGAIDIGLLALLIVATLAARAAVLFGLLPLLSALGLVSPVGARHKTVILWGGLRGAVTLTLALAISGNDALPAATRDFVATLATAYVLVTLFAGAATLRPLIRLLRLDRLDATGQVLRDRVMALTRRQVSGSIREIASEYGFDPALARPFLPEDGDEAENGAGGSGADGSGDGAALPDEGGDMLQVGLLTLASQEKELYLGHFRERTISRHLIGQLLAGANRLIDAVRTGGAGGYAAEAGRALRLSPAFHLALVLHRRTGWSGPLAARLASRFEALVAQQLVLRELVRFNRDAVRPLLGVTASRRLSPLLEERLAATADALAAVELQYPAWAGALNARYLGRAALRVEEAAYRRAFEQQLVPREVWQDLQQDLRRRRAKVEARPALDLGFNLAGMIGRVPVFSGMEAERRAAIARLLRPWMAMPGEVLVRRGRRGRAIWFVASGTVEVRLAGDRVCLGPGEFFGEIALLTGRPRTADVVARGYCHLLVLDGRDFRRLLRGDPDLRASFDRVAAARLAALGPGDEG